jgi:GINS complex subunit 4
MADMDNDMDDSQQQGGGFKSSSSYSSSSSANDEMDYASSNVHLESRHRLSPEVNELRQLWINEKGSPELLFFDAEVVSVVQFNLQQEQERVEQAQIQGTDATRIMLVEMDISRLQFLVHAYHRVRLQKIERHAIYILMTPEQVERLSSHEYEYLKSYVDLFEKLMNDSFLHHIPERFQSLTDKNADINMVIAADLHRHVFMRVREHIGTYEINDDGDYVEMKKNDILVGSYKAFRQLLHDQRIELI